MDILIFAKQLQTRTRPLTQPATNRDIVKLIQTIRHVLQNTVALLRG
jgi:hypothetical protein